MICQRSPQRKHYGLGTVGATNKGKRRKGYSFRRYSKGNKGHAWKGHGKERVCERCGFKPHS